MLTFACLMGALVVPMVLLAIEWMWERYEDRKDEEWLEELKLLLGTRR